MNFSPHSSDTSIWMENMLPKLYWVEEFKILKWLWFLFLFFILLQSGIKDFGVNSDFQNTWKGSKIDAFNLYFFDAS